MCNHACQATCVECLCNNKICSDCWQKVKERIPKAAEVTPNDRFPFDNCQCANFYCQALVCSKCCIQWRHMRTDLAISVFCVVQYFLRQKQKINALRHPYFFFCFRSLSHSQLVSPRICASFALYYQRRRHRLIFRFWFGVFSHTTIVCTSCPKRLAKKIIDMLLLGNKRFHIRQRSSRQLSPDPPASCMRLRARAHHRC